jgi:sugar phosphate isomerase/epimerase
MQVSFDRRGFLKMATTAGMALAATETLAASKRTGWKTAIGLNGFQSAGQQYKQTFPIWEILDFAAREGFDGVELVSDWPQGGYPESSNASRVRALRRLYDAYGLTIFSMQLGADGAFAPDEGIRRDWIHGFRDRVALAKQLGCECLGIWPGGGLRGQTLDQALDRLATSFREAAGIAQDSGILTAFEIEPPFVFNTEDHVRRILSQTAHPNLKAIYDPSHYDLMNGSLGRPHEMLARIGVEHIGYLHLTDTDGTLRNGGTSKHLACGDGHAQIGESLRVLREGGFRGWIMIDAWEIPDPYDASRKGLNMVREAGKRRRG